MGNTNISGVLHTEKIRLKGWNYDASVSVASFKMPGNCKQSILNQINTIAIFPVKERKAYLDKVLRGCHITVHLNTTDPALAKWIVDNYETYYNIAVPVGYGSAFHHHILIKNKLSGSGNTTYLRKAELVKVENNNGPKANKNNIKEQFLAVFKLRRRKPDIVPELINLL